jgi:predicted MFS family arabinose efflux permease
MAGSSPWAHSALIAAIGWRDLFLLLAVLSALAALLILRFVPERPVRRQKEASAPGMSICAIYRDARFRRLAPLSATTIGSAWALQGLWAGPWLSDVERLPRHDVVMHLLVMAIALSAFPLILGAAGDQLRRRGVSLLVSFAFATGIALLAQLALVLRWPLPASLPWIAIAGIGAGTVLSYAMLTELFPKSASGRASGALNPLHIGSAFAVQLGSASSWNSGRSRPRGIPRKPIRLRSASTSPCRPSRSYGSCGQGDAPCVPRSFPLIPSMRWRRRSACRVPLPLPFPIFGTAKIGAHDR